MVKRAIYTAREMSSLSAAEPAAAAAAATGAMQGTTQPVSSSVVKVNVGGTRYELPPKSAFEVGTNTFAKKKKKKI